MAFIHFFIISSPSHKTILIPLRYGARGSRHGARGGNRPSGCCEAGSPRLSQGTADSP